VARPASSSAIPSSACIQPSSGADRILEQPLACQVPAVRGAREGKVGCGERGQAQGALGLGIVQRGKPAPRGGQDERVIGLHGQRAAKHLVRLALFAHALRGQPGPDQQQRVVAVLVERHGKQVLHVVPQLFLGKRLRLRHDPVDRDATLFVARQPVLAHPLRLLIVVPATRQRATGILPHCTPLRKVRSAAHANLGRVLKRLGLTRSQRSQRRGRTTFTALSVRFTCNGRLKQRERSLCRPFSVDPA
jgi:hypothetical protein